MIVGNPPPPSFLPRAIDPLAYNSHICVIERGLGKATRKGGGKEALTLVMSS